MTADVSALLTAVAALAGIVGLILLIGRALRFTPFARPGSAERTLVVQETLVLDGRRRLYLVRHGQRSVLLLTGGASDVVVGWVEGPPAP